MFKKKKRPGKGMSVMKRSANGSDEDEDGGVDKEGLVKAVIGKRQKSHPGTISMDGTVKQVAAEEVRVVSFSVAHCVFYVCGRVENRSSVL